MRLQVYIAESFGLAALPTVLFFRLDLESYQMEYRASFTIV
jgi:hypothetical protein